MLRIQIQAFFYLNADPDSNPGSENNAEFLDEAYWYLMQVIGQKHTYKDTKDFLLILDSFHAPGSGSAVPLRIQIQDNQVKADPCGSGSTTMIFITFRRKQPSSQHKKYNIFLSTLVVLFIH